MRHNFPIIVSLPETFEGHASNICNNGITDFEALLKTVLASKGYRAEMSWSVVPGPATITLELYPIASLGSSP